MQGAAFSWGNGNYGKLGHRVQQDEFKPRPLETFGKRILALPTGVVRQQNQFCAAFTNLQQTAALPLLPPLQLPL